MTHSLTHYSLIQIYPLTHSLTQDHEDRLRDEFDALHPKWMKMTIDFNAEFGGSLRKLNGIGDAYQVRELRGLPIGTLYLKLANEMSTLENEWGGTTGSGATSPSWASQPWDP